MISENHGNIPHQKIIFPDTNQFVCVNISSEVLTLRLGKFLLVIHLLMLSGYGILQEIFKSNSYSPVQIMTRARKTN